MMRSSSLQPWLVGLALALLAIPARASVTFPEALRQQLGLAEIAGTPPGCQLCHRDDAGGVKTAIKPLGRSLLQAGAASGSVPSLQAALASLEANGTDSDGDGQGDIAELRAGTDPNVPDAVLGEGGAAAGIMPCPPPPIPLPETGCNLATAAAPTSAGLTLAGFAWLALLRRRRQR